MGKSNEGMIAFRICYHKYGRLNIFEPNEFEKWQVQTGLVDFPVKQVLGP